MRRLRLFLASAIPLGLVAFTIVACSSSDPRPPPDNTITGYDAYQPEVSFEGATGDSGTIDGSAIPKTCANTIRDGQETDVDCGGVECLKCIDGKACVADTDCAGGSCVDKVCTTANCKDAVGNGDESDVDCGGPICSKCTIGKRCKAGTDCASGTCIGDSCACPAGMAVVAKATGGAYCIDAVEVTKGQYNKFITANVAVTDQVAVCKPPANPTFIPRGAWPPATSPPGPPQVTNGLPFNLSLPVHYVDWCDAYAYCKWSNKQLCGLINGGTLATTDANDSTKSAWYNACSAQGTKAWPYGTSFDQDKCNGAGAGAPGPIVSNPTAEGYGYPANQDTGVYTVVDSDLAGNFTNVQHGACQGGSVGVYQMSGNVAEWEDSCDGADAAAACRLRGGSYTASNVGGTLQCDAARSLGRLPAVADPDPLRDVGIRCCLY